ncbi:MAG: DUF3284 domain-containing protein [Culicoidibacterales bacterium]
MAKKFTYEHILNYPLTDVSETVYDLTIKQMESIGTAISTPSERIGTHYQYEMLLKQEQVTVDFTIVNFVKDQELCYTIKAGRLDNQTTWSFEAIGEGQTKITYVEEAESNLTSAALTYRFLGWMMNRKQKKKTQQLFKVVEIDLYEAAQKKAQ